MKVYAGIQIAHCQSCDNIHFLLFKNYGDKKPESVMMLTAENAPQFIKDLQSAAYVIATRKDEKK